MSIASFRERLLDFRSCWIVFIHIVQGRPGGLLQFVWMAQKMSCAVQWIYLNTLWCVFTCTVYLPVQCIYPYSYSCVVFDVGMVCNNIFCCIFELLVCMISAHKDHHISADLVSCLQRSFLVSKYNFCCCVVHECDFTSMSLFTCALQVCIYLYNVFTCALQVRQRFWSTLLRDR